MAPEKSGEYLGSVEPDAIDHAVGEYWINTGLDFAFEVFHRLYYTSVFVQGGQWKAYTQARELKWLLGASVRKIGNLVFHHPVIFLCYVELNHRSRGEFSHT